MLRCRRRYPWVLLYVKRWPKASVPMDNCCIVTRKPGNDDASALPIMTAWSTTVGLPLAAADETFL